MWCLVRARVQRAADNQRVETRLRCVAAVTARRRYLWAVNAFTSFANLSRPIAAAPGP